MNLTGDAVAALFPPSVVAAVLPVSARHEPRSDGEAAAVARALPRRRDEFLTGRATARRALVDAGYEPVAVPRGERGAPVWPDGVVGSISHAGGWCVAVVGRAGVDDDVRGIGVDLHCSGGLDDPAVRVWVLTPWERVHDRGCGYVDVVFAAKEAVFKAVNPATGRWLEHHDVELDVHDGAFSVRRPVDLRGRLSGRWWVEGSLVLAGCALR
jgi:4'-phosphopantetheinyl transferase EntD